MKTKPKQRKLARTSTTKLPEIKMTKPKTNYPMLIAISLVVITFILTLLYFDSLPDNIITHWNLNGNADGYTQKGFGLFIVPLMISGLIILLYFIPKIDPLQKNINEFRTEYHTLIAVICGFFLYLQIVIITLNLGMNFDIRILLSPAFAVLIYSTGVLIRKAKRNFFIGIRTPWTMSSDSVWNKTHKKAGQLFKASAILSLIGLFIPEMTFFFIIVPLLLASLGVIIYSYFEYKKETKN